MRNYTVLNLKGIPGAKQKLSYEILPAQKNATPIPASKTGNAEKRRLSASSSFGSGLQKHLRVYAICSVASNSTGNVKRHETESPVVN